MRTYGAYGAGAVSGSSLSGYTGIPVEAKTGWYLLGNRPYDPVLRRFLSPDALSPFGIGGLHRYAYCGGDPINHVDPSGSVRFPVLSARRMDVIRRTAATGGASPNPTMSVVTTVAATNTSVSVDVLANTPIMRAPGDAPLGALARPNGSPSPPDERTERKVNVLHEEDFPEDRWTVDERGHPDLKNKWIENRHRSNENSTIFAADASIFSSDIKTLVSSLLARGANDISLYSGAHGHPSGMNWASNSFFRADFEQLDFLADDLEGVKLDAEKVGMNLYVADMNNFDRSLMQEMLAQDGIHVIGYCYGIADEEVMKAIGLRQTTVYAAAIPRPRYTWPMP